MRLLISRLWVRAPRRAIHFCPKKYVDRIGGCRDIKVFFPGGIGWVECGGGALAYIKISNKLIHSLFAPARTLSQVFVAGRLLGALVFIFGWVFPHNYLLVRLQQQLLCGRLTHYSLTGLPRGNIRGITLNPIKRRRACCLYKSLWISRKGTRYVHFEN